jgi:ABC-type branched-subunit amino acid transport system permease subunit
LSFVIGAFLGAWAVRSMLTIGIISARMDFDFNRSIELLYMVVLGGLGSIRAPLSAAILTICLKC